MDEIRESRAGRTRRNMTGEAAFNSFVPAALQEVAIERSDDLAREVEQTEAALAKLSEAFCALDPEQQAEAIEAGIRKEAESSWKLAEGRDLGPKLLSMPDLLGSVASLDIMSTASDVGKSASDSADDRRAANGETPFSSVEQREIDDLAAALRYALDPFDELPISRRLLENAHYLMTQSPRYEKLYPGEFRRSPNWIAGPNATLATARYVPPVDEDMTDAFSALERFIHDARDSHGDAFTPDSASASASDSAPETELHATVESATRSELHDPDRTSEPDESRQEPDRTLDASDLPKLVRIALAHYQFEAIHPFIDGNGRIGRILTLVMLRDAGLIPVPILPLSDVLRERAVAYYGSIDFVEHEGEYETWVKFFLLVLREAAERALAKSSSNVGKSSFL